jgi:dihydroorotate dehydrogenase
LVKNLKPWLLLPSKLAHDLSPYVLNSLSSFFKKDLPNWRPYEWQHLQFPNPMGIAGGVDKNAKNITGWANFGAGFLEIGTITPEPQSPNPGKIIDRNYQNLALWNKMGFPSKGLKYTLKNIKRQSKGISIPLFANIGKNRNTPNETAHQDYVTLIKALNKYVDGFVVNISSPNTKGLRHLLEPENLANFLKPILNCRNELCQSENLPLRPVLLKLSPNMSDKQFNNAIETTLKLNIDGWVLANTTTDYSSSLGFSTEGGGVSGKPLAQRSKELLQKLVSQLSSSEKEQKIIVSSGGILTPEDAKQRLDMGANLIEFYSALIFQGPWFFQQVVQSKKNSHNY